MATWDEEVHSVAAWVLELVRPAYGPYGGYTLLVGEGLELYDGAAAVRDLPSTASGLAPYRRLAADVHTAVGDQANLALQLSAGLVVHAYRAMDQGVPRPAILEGLELAGRQVRAWLRANSKHADPVQALEGADRAGWRDDVIPGLLRLADASLELDQVAIEHLPGATWLDGLHVALHGEDGKQDARILIVREGPRLKPRTSTVQRMAGTQAEDALLAAWFERLEALGVDVLFVRTGLDIRDRVQARMLVADNVPDDLVRRLQTATGAEPVARVEDATVADLGQADVARAPRTDGWMLHGPGPGATFNVGQATEPEEALRADRAERFLRTAGIVLGDPRTLPGAGRWQAKLVGALQAMADHAPGKASYGVRVVADALRDTHWALLRNAGRDPLDGGFVGEVLDPAAAVELAVDAAMQTATLLLRVDGRHAKRESNPAALRGGTGKAGSPKGMPGDIPPHM